MARLVPKIYPNDINPNTVIGVGFPLHVGMWNKNYNTSAQVKDNLRNLILTMKGERLMQPEFGCDLYQLLFEQMYNADLAITARAAIKSALKRWIPYVTLGNVSTTSVPDRNQILIKVTYSVQGWSADDTLNLAVNV
tara:strand:+ start:368 stop:778 length:411 start_codon:yes stop_codon:yes gene_type:complete